MAGLFVRKGDLVQVISGKDRGITGKVIEVFPESDRVIVEGLQRVRPGVPAKALEKAARPAAPGKGDAGKSAAHGS